MDRELISTSKFLSLVLRHQPETIGISLDDQGWVEIDELLAAANRSGRKSLQARLTTGRSAHGRSITAPGFFSRQSRIASGQHAGIAIVEPRLVRIAQRSNLSSLLHHNRVAFEHIGDLPL